MIKRGENLPSMQTVRTRYPLQAYTYSQGFHATFGMFGPIDIPDGHFRLRETLLVHTSIGHSTFHDKTLAADVQQD